METRQKKGKTKDTQKGKNAEKDTGKEEEVPSPSKETQGGTSGASQGVQTTAETVRVKGPKVMNDSQITDQNVVVVDMMEGEEDKGKEEDPEAEGNDGGRAMSHCILNSDVDSRILEKEEDLEVLLEEQLELMYGDEESQELVDVEKKISILKRKLVALRELRDFRKTKEQVSITVTKSSPQKPKSSWKVPSNLLVFRGSKGMEDPLEFVEQFE